MKRPPLVKTLCLDLSGTTGWVIGGAGGIEQTGSRHLPKSGNDIGAYACGFRTWLTGMVQKNGVKRIIFEAPILDKQNGAIAVKKMTGLAVVTEMVARDCVVECFECHLSQIRAYFIGTPIAPREIGADCVVPTRKKEIRRQWIKQRVIWECKERGHKPEDDNEADAIALFYYQYALLDPMRTLELLARQPEAEDADLSVDAT